MTVYEMASSGVSSDLRNWRSLELVCFGLVVAHAVYLAASFVQGSWLIDGQGHGIPTDFVNVWAAGRLVLDGRPETAYDWTTHKAIEDAAIGYAFEGYYAWLYPPPFLFVAGLLATLPFALAQAVWSFLTFPAYVVAIRAIVDHRLGILLAGAFPAVLSNFVVGQNGFLSAALLGGALGFMQRRPLLAGCCLGLLTYKPHLGLLFPFVLIASGRWRAFCVAAIAAALLQAASWNAFGTNAWLGFVQSVSLGSQAFLAEGQAGWNKLQSIFGIVRSLGGSESLAWSLQVSLIGVVAIMVCGIWRSRVSFDLKAAALGVGTLLATPYLYLYDLVALAVPMAFLFRLGLAGGFSRSEVIGLAGASFLVLIFPIVTAPLGALAVLLIAGLIGRRIVRQLRPEAPLRHFPPARA
jgi:arabinofuranan 3-O-arabinosyltransferase